MSKTGLHKLKGNSQHPELRRVNSQRWSNIIHIQAANVIPHWLCMFMMEEVRDTDEIPLSLKHLRNPPTHLSWCLLHIKLTAMICNGPSGRLWCMLESFIHFPPSIRKRTDGKWEFADSGIFVLKSHGLFLQGLKLNWVGI